MIPIPTLDCPHGCDKRAMRRTVVGDSNPPILLHFCSLCQFAFMTTTVPGDDPGPLYSLSVWAKGLRDTDMDTLLADLSAYLKLHA